MRRDQPHRSHGETASFDLAGAYAINEHSQKVGRVRYMDLNWRDRLTRLGAMESEQHGREDFYGLYATDRLSMPTDVSSQAEFRPYIMLCQLVSHANLNKRGSLHL